MMIQEYEEWKKNFDQKEEINKSLLEGEDALDFIFDRKVPSEFRNTLMKDMELYKETLQFLNSLGCELSIENVKLISGAVIGQAVLYEVSNKEFSVKFFSLKDAEKYVNELKKVTPFVWKYDDNIPAKAFDLEILRASTHPYPVSIIQLFLAVLRYDGDLKKFLHDKRGDILTKDLGL